MKDLKSFFAIFRADNPVSGQLQTHHQNATHSRFVVNDKQCGFDGLMSSHKRPIAI